MAYETVWFQKSAAKTRTKGDEAVTGSIRLEVILYYHALGEERSLVRMAKLAFGVVAAEDKSGECNALFNKDQWQFNIPEAWENVNLLLQKAGLNILPGAGRIPPIRIIEEMMVFARERLSPKGKCVWYNTPQLLVD